MLNRYSLWLTGAQRGARGGVYSSLESSPQTLYLSNMYSKITCIFSLSVVVPCCTVYNHSVIKIGFDTAVSCLGFRYYPASNSHGILVFSSVSSTLGAEAGVSPSLTAVSLALGSKFVLGGAAAVEQSAGLTACL